MAKHPRTYYVPQGFITARVERDLTRIAREPDFDPLDYRPAPLPRLFSNQSVVRSPLYEVEDHRSFQPDGLDQFRASSTRRRRVRLTLAKPPRRSTYRLPRYGRPIAVFSEPSRPRLQFTAPRHVLVCVRRKRRREVLHALRIAGRRGRGGRRYHRNAYSDVRC